MNLNLFFCFLLFSTTLASFASSSKIFKENCPATYTELDEAIIENTFQCIDLVEVITEDLTDCKLREGLQAFVEQLICVYGKDNIGWIEADLGLNWDIIQARMIKIQVKNELENAVQGCQGEVETVQQDNLEVLTQEIFGIESQNVGSQEECWKNALKEVKAAMGIRCIFQIVNKNHAAYCQL